LRHVGPPILTSAATTAAGFAVLGFAHLPPLRELGLLVALGILAILAAMATAGGAAWVLVAPRLRPPGPLWHWLGSVGDLLPAFAARRPRLVLTAAAAVTAAAIWAVGGLTVDPDVRTLRPVDHPAHEAEELLAERFGVGLDTATVVVHGDDLPAALAAAGAAADKLRRELSGTAVSSPADFLTLGEAPAERLRRLAALPLERAATDLERELAGANLDPRAFARGLEALRALGRGEDPGAPPADVWPEWISRSLTSDDDGAWAAVGLRLPPGTWPDGPPPTVVESVRAVAPGAAFASAVAVGSELRSLAVSDLRTLSLLALAAVAAVVTVSFRGRLGASALAGLPVILGSLWTLALWAALGRSLDLFTLAVLPILLGIGIDDGLHVVHGALADPAAGIRGAVQTSCRALTLTTLTTCAGFGSLVFSRIPGLKNGGALIAVGVLTCLLTTLLVLPAIEAARSKS
ncbi:MAG: MMPL family transporter, partial [Thermoanaerobaculia bacterium]